MKTLIRKPLSVKKSTIHGYGVFADVDIAAGEIIEECHTILTEGGDDKLSSYYFQGGKYYAFATGFGSIYNHAEDCNASYEFNEETSLITFKATRNIRKNEEIFISYGEGWFQDRKMPIKHISFLRKVWLFFKKIPLRALVIIGGIYLFISVLQHLTPK